MRGDWQAAGACVGDSPQELKQMIVGHSRSFPIDIAHHRARRWGGGAGGGGGGGGGGGSPP